MTKRNVKITVLFTGLLFLMFAFRVMYVQMAQKSQVNQVVKEDKLLFDALMEEGLISRKTPSSQLLVLPEPDMQIFYRENKQKDRENLLKELNSSLVGRAVKKEIQLWNQQHLFSAVRDNRPLQDKSAYSWEVFDPSNPNIFQAGLKAVPEFCVFVTQGKFRPGYHDWVKSPTSRTVGYKTRIHLDKAATVQVQVIGEVSEVQPKGDIRPIAIPDTVASFRKLKAFEPSAAAQVNFKLPAGDHELRLIVSPTEFFFEHVIPGLHITWNRGTSPARPFLWQDLKEEYSKKDSSKSVKVTTKDGVELLENGEPTKSAWELGLVPLTGVNREFGSLGSIFSASDVGEIRLTIDSTLQKLALEKLQEQIQKYGRDRYMHERRGSVVLLDTDSGEILAAASMPQMQKGGHPWDYTAFRTYYPDKNPQTFFPWHGLTNDNSPGSTFKPVVALSAFQAMQDNAENSATIKQFINGYRKPDEMARKTGLTKNCVAFNAQNSTCYRYKRRDAITNFKKIPFGHFWRKSDRRYGLRQAVRDSLNVWFTQLAWVTDGDACQEYDGAWESRLAGAPEPAPLVTHLGEMVKELGLVTPVDLLANIDDKRLHVQRICGSSSNREGDAACGAAGHLDILGPPAPRPASWIIQQNAIGQGVSMTPLNMARVAAAVAAGKVVSPVLVAAIDGKKTETEDVRELNLAKKTMTLLREGMAQVVRSQYGTAYKAFKGNPRREFVYGKTGTAEIAGSGGRYYATWFIGWKDPEQKTSRRVAFASWVSHAHGKAGNSGGSAAAPIISKIMQEGDFASE